MADVETETQDVPVETNPWAAFPPDRYSVTRAQEEGFASGVTTTVVVCSEHGIVARLDFSEATNYPPSVTEWAGFKAGLHEGREHSDG